MLDVEIHNFQSIEHVRVRIEGFTALVGRSNLGKSAIVRAIKAALTGAPEETSVRHGVTCEREVKGTKTCKCFCSVHLKAEGFDLLWQKGGDKNEYVFNGDKKTAVGKGTPSFLEEAFGVVKIGDDKVLLQVADQFRSEGGGPIFLLDQSGSVVADVLSDVAQLDRINVATKMAESDRRSAIAERKVREKDVMDLKVKVAGYDGLDQVLARVRGVEVGEAKVAAQRTRRDLVGTFKEAVIRVGRQLRSLVDVSKVPVPDFDPAIKQHANYKTIADYISATESRQAVITRLEVVDTLVIPSIDPLFSGIASFQKLFTWRGKFRALQEFFARAKTAGEAQVPEFDSILVASKKASTLSILTGRLLTLLQLQDFLARSKVVEGVIIPQIDDLQTNTKKMLARAVLLVRFRGAEDQLGNLERANEKATAKEVEGNLLRIRYRATAEHIGRLEHQLAAVETEHQGIQAEEDELGVCPTCTQPVAAGLVHEHAAE